MTVPALDSAPTSQRWADASAWVGEGLRREAFFFPSGGADLYGSVYAAVDRSTPFGLVFCNAWGFEGNRAGRIAHRVSVALAEAGGVAFTFHYPGFGDSSGEFAEATMDVLADAAADAVAEARRHHPGVRWTLAGLRLGASVASLATARGHRIEDLLLIQPALRPGPYFKRLERASKRSLGGSAPSPTRGFAFGYPLSPTVLASAPAGDSAVAAALARFDGEGTAIRYEIPAKIEGLPERFEQIVAAGAWRIGEMENHPLVNATARWLRERAQGSA